MRLRSIHVINCSSYLDRILALVRPFMRKDVAKLVSGRHGSCCVFFLQISFVCDFAIFSGILEESEGKCCYGQMRCLADHLFCCLSFFLSCSQLHCHKPDTDTFYKYVPKDLLPTEYGGKAGDIDTLKADFAMEVANHR